MRDSAHGTVICILLVVFAAYGLWSFFKATWGYWLLGGVVGTIGVWAFLFLGAGALMAGGLWYYMAKSILRKK